LVKKVYAQKTLNAKLHGRFENDHEKQGMHRREHGMRSNKNPLAVRDAHAEG